MILVVTRASRKSYLARRWCLFVQMYLTSHYCTSLIWDPRIITRHNQSLISCYRLSVRSKAFKTLIHKNISNALWLDAVVHETNMKLLRVQPLLHIYICCSSFIWCDMSIWNINQKMQRKIKHHEENDRQTINPKWPERIEYASSSRSRLKHY